MYCNIDCRFMWTFHSCATYNASQFCTQSFPTLCQNYDNWIKSCSLMQMYSSVKSKNSQPIGKKIHATSGGIKFDLQRTVKLCFSLLQHCARLLHGTGGMQVDSIDGIFRLLLSCVCVWSFFCIFWYRINCHVEDTAVFSAINKANITLVLKERIDPVSDSADVQ